MKVTALMVAAAGTVLAVGSTVAFANIGGSVAGAATAPYVNTFERPVANAPYLLNQWAADGWKASSELGLATRSSIDTSTAHSGAKSLRVLYPKGKISPENSGLTAKFAVTPAREYYFSQWVRFSEDFSWGTTQYAGKIGVGVGGGATCSGGKACTGYNGFTSRFIWRSGGRASLYYYHMGHEGVYGDDADFQLNGSSVNYPRGQWVNLTQRVKVNTVTGGEADANGEIEAWYNGQRVVNVTGLRFVRNTDLVDAMYFSSFFGGATETFAPLNDSVIHYDDFKASTSRADICEINGGCTGTPPTTTAKPPTTTKPPTPPTTTPPTTTRPATPTASPTVDPGGSAWKAYQAYAIGQTVTYGGATYTCRQAHTALPGWEPANVPALWLRR
jgi:hypothetical protein